MLCTLLLARHSTKPFTTFLLTSSSKHTEGPQDEWKNLLHLRAQRVVVTDAELNKQLVTSRVSHALILGLIPVNYIWNQKHYKSADEAKLVGEVDKLEIRVTVKTDLNRLSWQELRGVQRRQARGPAPETESFPAAAQAELWLQKPCWKGGDLQQGQRTRTSSNIPATLGPALHHPLFSLSQAMQNWRVQQRATEIRRWRTWHRKKLDLFSFNKRKLGEISSLASKT